MSGPALWKDSNDQRLARVAELCDTGNRRRNRVVFRIWRKVDRISFSSSFPFCQFSVLLMLVRSRCGHPRECQIFFSICSPAGSVIAPPQKGGARLCSLKKRERSAVRRMYLPRALARARTGFAKAGSPYGAPLRCLKTWNPSSLWPLIGGFATNFGRVYGTISRGCIVSREAVYPKSPGTTTANRGRGHRSPFTLSFASRTSLSEWG